MTLLSLVVAAFTVWTYALIALLAICRAAAQGDVYSRPLPQPELVRR